MSHLYTSIRFVMALLTVLAIAGKPFIPPKTLTLYPSPAVNKAIYGPVLPSRLKSVHWLDQTSSFLRCELPIAANQTPCGVVFSWSELRESECQHRIQHSPCSTNAADPDGDGWGTESGVDCVTMAEDKAHSLAGIPLCVGASSDPDGDGWGWENEQSCLVVTGFTRDQSPPLCTLAASDPDGDGWGWENDQSCRVSKGEDPAACAQAELADTIDATGYDGLMVKVHYEGRSPYLRMNVMGHDPALRSLGKKPKPMSTYLSTEQLRTGTTFVRLDDLNVEEWWMVYQNPPRHLATADFQHITQVSFDTYEVGVHRLRVEEISLTGDRIDTEAYLLAIAVFWACYLLGEGGWRYYRLRTTYQSEQQRLSALVGDAQQLEEEKRVLEQRCQTDPLTQALNRHGLTQRLQAQYGRQRLPSGTGVLVLDIDHFKNLNDTYGHDAGDAVLKELCAVIGGAIRIEDLFARWGGEEFVLIVDHLPEDKLMAVADKLRQQVQERVCLQEPQLVITISIGVARSRAGETFDDAFKRADVALYQAKIQRNTVAFAP